ncbi:MAG TPA: ketoacyl-ACP synthase III, partial [Burkholderiales bacterium]|nr:ketoacyl-ACP synthase III [Burkholderiales bacterium]
MASSTLRNVAYRGLATCVPKTVVSNLDDCPPAMRSERERLVRNIGIARRRICKPWQFFSTLAQDAAERLLEELAWKREDIDALIVVSQSPDYLIPATSIMIQDRMKLSTATLAF